MTMREGMESTFSFYFLPSTEEGKTKMWMRLERGVSQFFSLSMDQELDCIHMHDKGETLGKRYT